MIEALTILGAAALLLAISAAGYYGGGETLFAVAAVITAGGFLFAFVTGSLYHAELFVSIRAAERPPRLWWLHPSRHHGLIPKKKTAPGHGLVPCRRRRFFHYPCGLRADASLDNPLLKQPAGSDVDDLGLGGGALY